MTTTKKKRRKKSVKKLKYSNKKLNFIHIATLAGIILILLVIVLAARGCGKISHRTPEGVVEGYIKAAAAGKNKKMQSCYSADKLSDEAQTEISTAVAPFLKTKIILMFISAIILFWRTSRNIHVSVPIL